MMVKLFDEENEMDLEMEMNLFFQKNPNIEIVKIDYSTSHFITHENEQIYSFSALVVYDKKRK